MSAKVRAGGKSASMLVEDKHRRLIFRLSIVARLLVFVLVHISARLLPLFDASPVLLNLHPLLRPLYRWDVFHFFHISQHFYVYEHEWAFFPALPFIIRYDLGLLAVLACNTSQTLYSLSLYHLPSPNHALLATLLSLLPASPVTAYFAPYTEPFFTYLSYQGMSKTIPSPSFLPNHGQVCYVAPGNNGFSLLYSLHSQECSDPMAYFSPVLSFGVYLCVHSWIVKR